MGEFKTSIIPVDINKKCFTIFAIMFTFCGKQNVVDVVVLWLQIM